MTKSKKQTELEQQIGELTQDLQRQRADFENYRKRVETEKEQAKETGKMQAVMKLLPIIDNIDRAVAHLPAELQGNAWADGVVKLSKHLDKMVGDLSLEKIAIIPGETLFDPSLHEAIQMDDAEGDTEVVAEELQTGWKLGDTVIRPAMVKVTRTTASVEQSL
jgi:molecular chaperone GrpE